MMKDSERAVLRAEVGPGGIALVDALLGRVFLTIEGFPAEDEVKSRVALLLADGLTTYSNEKAS